jgi:glycosyltransferase involved in cell wall biosynthesis
MRCVHYLSHVRLEGGGVARAVLDFCRVFAALGHEVTLVTNDSTDVPPEWRGEPSAGAPRAIVLDPLGGPLQRLGRSSREAVDGLLASADVLHLHGPWEAANAQWGAAARRRGVPYVLTPHGMLDLWSMRQRRWKKRLYLALAGDTFLRGAARVHCTARAELDQASRWFDKSRGVVIPYVIDLAPYASLPGPEPARAKFGIAGDVPTVLFLSRVHPKKGPELLIDAAAELKRRGVACRTLIAGPGDPEYIDDLRERARDCGVDGLVEFVGMVRGEEKLSLYQAADVFVLPTSQENFGLVLLESLACRTPVVTTGGVDIWKELQEAGGVIVGQNVLEIATAVEGVLTDPARRASLGERGRAWVMEHLAPDRVARQYEEMYRDVLRPRGSPV